MRKTCPRLGQQPPAVDVETGNENDGPIPGNGRADTRGRDGIEKCRSEKNSEKRNPGSSQNNSPPCRKSCG